MSFDQLLLELGISFTSNAIVEFIKNLLESNPGIDRSELKQRLATLIDVQGADIKADKVIQFLADSGDINISGSKIYASNSITMVSKRDTKFTFGNNSSSRTNQSSIEAGHGAQIIGQGGARIEQDEDGNIKFSA